MRKPIGLSLIAIYFFAEGLFGLYRLTDIFQGKELSMSHFIILVISMGFLLSGIGLFLQKGWGRNFTLFFNFFILFNGARNILSYFVSADRVSFIIKGLLNLFMAMTIFFYLLNRKVRAKFTKSPVSLIVLGFFLSIYGIKQRTGNALIDYFWLTMAIVGFYIIFRGTKQLKS